MRLLSNGYPAQLCCTTQDLDLHSHLEDLDNRGRRHSVRIRGLPEGVGPGELERTVVHIFNDLLDCHQTRRLHWSASIVPCVLEAEIPIPSGMSSVALLIFASKKRSCHVPAINPTFFFKAENCSCSRISHISRRKAVPLWSFCGASGSPNLT